MNKDNNKSEIKKFLIKLAAITFAIINDPHPMLDQLRLQNKQKIVLKTKINNFFLF